MIFVPDVKGTITPLNPEVEIAQEVTEEGLKLTVKNYREDMYVVGFKGVGLE